MKEYEITEKQARIIADLQSAVQSAVKDMEIGLASITAGMEDEPTGQFRGVRLDPPSLVYEEPEEAPESNKEEE